MAVDLELNPKSYSYKLGSFIYLFVCFAGRATPRVQSSLTPGSSNTSKYVIFQDGDQTNQPLGLRTAALRPAGDAPIVQPVFKYSCDGCEEREGERKNKLDNKQKKGFTRAPAAGVREAAE